MGNKGRICFVAIPFLATLAAFIALLLATLGGKHIEGLYMFKLDLSELSIGTDAINDLVKGVVGDKLDNVKDLVTREQPEVDIDTALLHRRSNLTAADLTLENYYFISVWGTCSGESTDKTKCTDPKFNWANTAINTTYLETIGKAMGSNVTLPSGLKDGLKVFSASVKGLQILLVASLALLGLELLFGLFTGCSRVMSCFAWVSASLATLAAVGSAAVSTAVAFAVVGLIKGASKIYGVDASVNTRFIAIVWIAAALALFSGLFFCISVCCCSPEKRDKRRNVHDEKSYDNGSYQPLDGTAQMSGANQRGFEHHNVTSPHHSQQYPTQYPAQYPNEYSNQQQSSGKVDAYEPYSHRV